MKYFYFPYVRIANGIYHRLEYSLEEITAAHQIRHYADKVHGCCTPVRFLKDGNSDIIYYWDMKRNIRLGFIIKERVQECQTMTVSRRLA